MKHLVNRTGIILVVIYLPFLIRCQAQELTYGIIVKNPNDTISVTIWKNKNKRKDQNSNYSQLIIVDSMGNQSILKPEDISGFIKDNVYYRSFKPNSTSKPAFFAKSLTIGKVELYYSDYDHAIYYFRMENEKAFYVLDSDPSFEYNKDTFGQSQIDGNGGVMYADLNFASNEEAFANFFMDFFRNSTGIVNKLKSKIYGFNDIRNMFKEYNQLFN